jgi:hypothetical protein
MHSRLHAALARGLTRCSRDMQSFFPDKLQSTAEVRRAEQQRVVRSAHHQADAMRLMQQSLCRRRKLGTRHDTAWGGAGGTAVDTKSWL